MGAGPVVVLDTNVLVSAFGWEGPERRVYRLARAGLLRVATSTELLAELKRVLGYPKFGLKSSQIDQIMDDVHSVASLVAPTREVKAIPLDPADDRVLECALAAEADWIVSGDQHLLDLGRFEGTRIVTARKLLQELGRAVE